MKPRRSKTILFIWVMVNLVTSLAWGSPQDIIGAWMGPLSVSGVELRMVFTIQVDQDGLLAATLDSPDQGIYDIPISAIHYEARQLTLVCDAIAMTFQARLVSGRQSNQLDGQWKQGGQTLTLKMKQIEEVPRRNRPQEPQPPFPYVVQDVVFNNTQADIQLAGTLTIPQGPGPFPVLVTISGSGAQDRNSTLFGHKPFWVLSDYLTRLGVAVLRYDDRGVGGSGNTELEATSADLAQDVRAAVSFLMDHPSIDPNRIGLIGHSEGGMIAPMVATEIDSIALIVLLAGPGLPGSQILLDQNEDIIRAQGGTESDIEKRLTYLRRVFQILQDHPDDTTAQQKIRESLIQIHGPGISQADLDSEAEAWTSAWLRFFVLYDPAPTLGQVTCPVLALFGELDIQVHASRNLPVMEAVLGQSGHTDYLVQTLDGLNHLFQTAQMGVVEEYIEIEETFSPAALDLIGGWIAEGFVPTP